VRESAGMRAYLQLIAVLLAGAPVVEDVDSDRDGKPDQRTITTFTDAGIATQEQFFLPSDGGHPRRRTLSTALGGNKRRIEEQLWIDGGWVTENEFESRWRDERHFGR
jgi:hypothetical protein